MLSLNLTEPQSFRYSLVCAFVQKMFLGFNPTSYLEGTEIIWSIRKGF
jgi:hypothetical protein